MSRFQFSLRTLLLLVLFLGASGALWWRWAPWAIEKSFSSATGNRLSIIPCSYSPDGKRIVTAGAGVQVWDVESGAEVLRPKLSSSWAWSAVHSPDGKRISAAFDDGWVFIFDASTGEVTGQFKCHMYNCHTANFSPDGTRIVTGGCANHKHDRVRVWDAATGTQLAETSDAAGGAVFSSDGKLLVTTNSEGMATVWDVESGAKRVELRDNRYFALDAAFSSDGKRVITASKDKAQIWDIASGKVIATRIGIDASTLSVDSDGLERFDTWPDPIFLDRSHFSPDRKRVVSATLPGGVQIFVRRRPDRIWGVWALWEFWMTIVFAGGFAWSVLRDRRPRKEPGLWECRINEPTRMP